MVNIKISFSQNYMISCPRRQYPSHSYQTKSA